MAPCHIVSCKHGTKFSQELRKRLLTRANEDCISMGSGLVGQRRHMQPIECDERAVRAIVIGQSVGSIGVGDVNLDDDEVGPVVRAQRLNVIVHQFRLVVVGQECGESGEPQWWE